MPFMALISASMDKVCSKVVVEEMRGAQQFTWQDRTTTKSEFINGMPKN